MSKLRNAGLAGCLMAVLAVTASAQLGVMDKQQRVNLTQEWNGERFADGRPKAPDALIERLRDVSEEEAWAVLNKAGFKDHFERGWVRFNDDGKALVGRAVTARFMPIRKDVNAAINKAGKEEGRVGKGQNSWVIDTLVTGDVLVVDLYGKYNFMGDNLATSIYSKTGNGVVIHGGARDLAGIQEIDGFTGFVRGWHPSSVTHGVWNTMLMGINVPIRIGDTTVMPGDIVLSGPEGIMFIPPQLAQKVVEASERVRLKDEWGHRMLREGRYTPGQVDGKWSDEMNRAFREWAQREKGVTLP